jgi:hypothetical protein
MQFIQPTPVNPRTAIFNYNVDFGLIINPSDLRVVVFDDPRDCSGKRIGLQEIVEFVNRCTNLAVLAIRSPTRDYSVLFGCAVINGLDQLWLGVAPSLFEIQYHSVGRSFFAHKVSDAGFDRLPDFYNCVRLSNILSLNPKKVVEFVGNQTELRFLEYGYVDMDSFVNFESMRDDTTFQDVCAMMADRDVIYDMVDAISPTICYLKFVGCEIPGGVMWNLKDFTNLKYLSVMYSWIDWHDLELEENETLELCFVGEGYDDLRDPRFTDSETHERYEFPGWV